METTIDLENFIDKDRCEIVRDERGVRLFDQHGDSLFSFDDRWTDYQIWKVVDFANSAFNTGLACGQAHMKARVSRRLFGEDA